MKKYINRMAAAFLALLANRRPKQGAPPAPHSCGQRPTEIDGVIVMGLVLDWLPVSPLG